MSTVPREQQKLCRQIILLLHGRPVWRPVNRQLVMKSLLRSCLLFQGTTFMILLIISGNNIHDLAYYFREQHSWSCLLFQGTTFLIRQGKVNGIWCFKAHQNYNKSQKKPSECEGFRVLGHIKGCYLAPSLEPQRTWPDGPPLITSLGAAPREVRAVPQER